MSEISKQNQEKIKEEILLVLYENTPKALHTSKISGLIIRDEEFTLKLLEELEKQNLIVKVNKNALGMNYLARKRWKLSKEVYDAYKGLV